MVPLNNERNVRECWFELHAMTCLWNVFVKNDIWSKGNERRRVRGIRLGYLSFSFSFSPAFFSIFFLLSTPTKNESASSYDETATAVAPYSISWKKILQLFVSKHHREFSDWKKRFEQWLSMKISDALMTFPAFEIRLQSETKYRWSWTGSTLWKFGWFSLDNRRISSMHQTD